MNIYGDPADEEWFVGHYKATDQKLNMGKSCVRLKTLDEWIPCRSISVAWACRQSWNLSPGSPARAAIL